MRKPLVMFLLMLFSIVILNSQSIIPIRQGVNIEWFRSGVETDDGCAIYVWSDTKLGARDLYAQKVAANGNQVWGQPLLVDGKPDRQEDPVISKTSDGNVIIAWIDFSDDLDGNVYAQKVNQNGQLMWQTGGVPVCVYPEIQISLNIEPDNSGGVYIVWEDSRNPSKDLYGQHLSGTGQPLWTLNGIPIANGIGNESYNTMWADGAGGLIIGYVYELSGAEDLFIKRFLPDGTMAWNQPLALSPHTAKQNKIKMAPINNNSFVFTWMDSRNIHPDIYAQRVSIDGVVMWPDPYIVYSDNNAPDPKPQENPRIINTSDNAVIIVWEDKRNEIDDPDLYSQKINLNGQKLWNPDGVPVAVANFGQRGPRLSADTSGGCFIVWDDSRNGNAPNIDVYAQHLSSNGLELWETGGKPICTSPNEQSGSLVKRSGNNIYINWMDMRDGSVGIYYQVLNLQGMPQLAQNGVQVFWGLSGDASLKQIVMLPRQNDAIVLWQDTRYANLGYQIFYQIINSDSSIDFEENGRALTTLSGYDQNDLSAVVLPDDKIAVVWQDNRTGNPKIYAQLLDANGNRLWGDSGIPVTESDPLSQKNPKISYHDGALYIGWSNLDEVQTPFGATYYFHIYGQKYIGNQKMWGPNGVLISHIPSSDPLFECQLEALVDRYYVWTRYSVNPDTFGMLNVWVKLVNSEDGSTVTGWSDFGMVTSNYTVGEVTQYLPKAVITDLGIFIEWLDFRIDDIKNLYGQLISPTGQILWDPAGVSMADYGREQDEFSLLGGNNVTFVWKESVTGANQDIAIQRYSLQGEPLWGDYGFFVAQRDTTQSSPNISRFHNGNMMVVWEDYLEEDSDLYMRFVNNNGSLVGPNTGTVVCDEIKIQQHGQIAVFKNPASNKAVVLWSDGRSSGKTPIFGLYAKIYDNVSLEDNTTNSSSSILQLRQNYPNPFSVSTKINIILNKNVKNMELSIYNIKGQLVKQLYKGNALKGNLSFVWDCKDSKNNEVSSGVYFYTVKAYKSIETKKMLLIK